MKLLNRFKKSIRSLIAAGVALAAIMFTLPASAQFVGPSTMTVPTSVAASTTNTTYASSNWVASAVSGQKMGVGLKFNLTGAGTSAVVFKFDASLDGASWETAAYSITQTANGTTAVVKNGNFDLGGLGYVRLSSVENPNATAVTNIVIRYGHKRGT